LYISNILYRNIFYNWTIKFLNFWFEVMAKIS